MLRFVPTIRTRRRPGLFGTMRPGRSGMLSYATTQPTTTSTTTTAAAATAALTTTTSSPLLWNHHHQHHHRQQQHRQRGSEFPAVSALPTLNASCCCPSLPSRSYSTSLLASNLPNYSNSSNKIKNENKNNNGNKKVTPLGSRLLPRWYSHTAVRNKVFVSRHNKSLNVTANNILEYCNNRDRGLTHKARTTSTHVILRECPFCKKPTNDKVSNLYKLHIQIGGGAFFCHRCGTGGSWYDFKAGLGGYHVENASLPGTTASHSTTTATTMPHGATTTVADASSNNSNYGGTTACLPMPAARLSGYYSSLLLDQPEKDNSAVEYLTKTRGLDRKTLRKYGVGRATTYKFPCDQTGGYQEAECITFPWIMRASDVQAQESLRGATYVDESVKDKHESKSNLSTKTERESEKETDPTNSSDKASEIPTGAFVTRRIKVRAVEKKAWQRLDPAGGGWGLFGLHTVPDDAKEIVLTEGEYDAMAVSQATGYPSVSLPNGCRSLPVQVLPLLERFEKIYLWMDNDAPGQEGAEKFAKKLGLNRCFIVQCREAKDANEALLKNLDMNELLESAALVPHDRILTFQDLRSEVLQELLYPEKYTGAPVPSLPMFTNLIKGFRRGELTVLTGPTGSGKTTFLGQVSLDMAEQGINVLWGSFEIKNTRLLHKLLKQFSRDALPDIKAPNAAELFDSLADRFEGLPMSFLRFHGGSEVDEVLDAMEYAVYVNDVEHIILDNMQFMISRNINSGRPNSFDKFEVQDIAIEKFRKFATEHNIHLTLVVHPRKEDEASKLNISSFYGSAKATQEADTVVILQNDGRRKYIEVKKNRFDGTLGYAPLYFQSKSGRYVDTEGDGQSKTFSASREKKESLPIKQAASLEKHWNSIGIQH